LAAVKRSAQGQEMLGALAAKRRRADTMTPGQKSDLARFESVYQERCKAGD
jgi:hypothetical protein